jgi:hypothetical protein
MVTKSESQVIEEYKKEGYFNVHSGATDFIFYKVKEGVLDPKVEDIDIDSVIFCEVKYNGDNLSHEQLIWKYILEKLGLKYKLIHISPKSTFGVS